MQFPPMQSLLSPAERHAFQSFLSTMDYPSDTLTANEWAIYNGGAQTHDGLEDPSLLTDTPPEQREALSKATKDLMSLDTSSSRWEGNGSMLHQQHHLSPQQMYRDHGTQRQDGFEMQHDQHFHHQQPLQHHQQQHHHELHQQNSYSNNRGSFPFLRDENMDHGHSQDELQYPQEHHSQQQLLNTSHNGHANHDPSPLSPHSPFQFQHQDHSNRSGSMQSQQPHLLLPQPQSQHQIHLPPPQGYQGAVPSSSRLPNGQSHRQGTTPTAPPSSSSSSTRNAHSTSTAAASSSGRRSASSSANATSQQTQQQASGSGSASTSTSNAPKQALLSPSQKKANHIQSEQKRRANIRRGYEALCETVPALREAIRQEEEEAERNSGGRAGANGARKKSRAKKGGQKDGDDKDKLDGRAGPRSENVVLSKTIDHIQALLADRSALIARLHRARSSLPPGHPALIPMSPDPLWEREWKGGSGRLGDEDQDAEGGSDNDDGDDD